MRHDFCDQGMSHIIRYRLRSRKLLQIVEPFSVVTLLGGPNLLERLSSEVKYAMLKGHKACSSEESSSSEERKQVCFSVVNKQEQTLGPKVFKSHYIYSFCSNI